MRCPYCGIEEYGSHYHCVNCGRECSMMGHLATDRNVYWCERVEGPWNDAGKSWSCSAEEKESDADCS